MKSMSCLTSFFTEFRPIRESNWIIAFETIDFESIVLSSHWFLSSLISLHSEVYVPVNSFELTLSDSFSLSKRDSNSEIEILISRG